MSQARKYAFDTEFDASGGVVRASRTRLTPEAVEAERQAAYARGKEDAVAIAERQAAAALEALAAAAAAVLSRLDAESGALRADAALLARISARKIAGAALDGFGQERIVDAIDKTLDLLRHQPRLVVRLSPEMADLLKPRIEALRDAHAYGGAILVRAEPGLGAGAVALDWSDGVAIVDPVEIEQRISALIGETLSQPESPE